MRRTRPVAIAFTCAAAIALLAGCSSSPGADGAGPGASVATSAPHRGGGLPHGRGTSTTPLPHSGGHVGAGAGAGRSHRGSGKTPAAPPFTDPVPGTYRVGIVEATYVDPDGVAQDYATGTTMPRTLVTEIRYPTLAGTAGGETPGAPPAREFGPYPVVLFAHGFDVTPDTYAALLDAWVEHGFVVVAPLFPDENENEVTAFGGPDSEAGSEAESDMYNEPHDLAYLIGALENDASTRAPGAAGILDGLIDPSRLVLAGQSDGADAVAALAFDDYYASTWDDLAVRPMALAILSGAEFGRGVDSYSSPIGSPAVLVVQSNADECNAPQDSTVLYGALGGPKWFLELDGATHLGPYSGYDVAASAVVESETIALFRLELGDLTPSMAQFDAAGDVGGVSSLSSGAAAPPIAPLYPTPSEVAIACWEP